MAGRAQSIALGASWVKWLRILSSLATVARRAAIRACASTDMAGRSQPEAPRWEGGGGDSSLVVRTTRALCKLAQWGLKKGEHGSSDSRQF